MISGLALKAEAAFAVQLITRHRAPRLVAILVTAVVIIVAKAAVPEAQGGLSPSDLVVGLAVIQGAVVGSRLSTPAALAAARAAGAPASVIVIGRLVGAVAVVLPVVFVQATVAVPLAALGRVLTLGTALVVSGAAAAMASTRWMGSTLGALVAGTAGIAELLAISAWRAKWSAGILPLDHRIGVAGGVADSWGTLPPVAVAALALVGIAILSTYQRSSSLESPERVMSPHLVHVKHARRR